ncbi:hypothetical protein NHX12_021448 [Muraenolepis orangiensis]|uniref:Uncharacterized protein n=1 Tax=Muraenolepis orangiensis TaxID=630683 RepID=A0A9Q0ETL3_9TELE|nr:hypothetical protein NHX12_021448 [Muraenolepis orangiensis]
MKEHSLDATADTDVAESSVPGTLFGVIQLSRTTGGRVHRAGPPPRPQVTISDLPKKLSVMVTYGDDK